MFGFIIAIHVILCILVAAIILMQSGRGGGLTESFAAAESMFGAKTNTVLVKATAVLVAIFLITCLGLAVLSSKANRSLIDEKTLAEQSAAKSGATPTAESTDQKQAVNTGSQQAQQDSGAATQGTPSPVSDIKTTDNAHKENLQAQQVPKPQEPKNP